MYALLTASWGAGSWLLPERGKELYKVVESHEQASMGPKARDTLL